jgi:NADH:ubiquinone oxidoreductase subunit E
MLEILEATQAEYGHLPVAALKLISNRTGAWYAMIYGTASYYRHLRFEPPAEAASALAARTASAREGRETAFLAGLDASLRGSSGTRRAAPGAGPARA